MKKKACRKFFMVAAAITLAGAIGGCGTTPPAQNEGDATKTTPPPSSKALIMGTNAQFPPFEFQTENGVIGEFDGIDIAIAAEIGKKMGVDVKVENMAFDALLPSLQSGKVNFVAAGMTVTEERKQNVDFSEPYFLAKQVIMYKEGADIKSAKDLLGKTVGVVATYTGDVALTEYKEENDDKVEPHRYKKALDAVMDLNNGKVQAVVIDAAPAAEFLKKNPGLAIAEDSEVFESESYALAVKKGDTELLNKINGILKELIDDGTIDEFAQKYQG